MLDCQRRAKAKYKEEKVKTIRFELYPTGADRARRHPLVLH